MRGDVMNDPQAVAEWWSGLTAAIVMGGLTVGALMALVVALTVWWRREAARHEVACPECGTTIRARMADQ